MIVSRLRWHFVAYQPARGLEVEHGEHRFQERGVHPLALAGRLALDQGDQDALSQEDPGAEVRCGSVSPSRTSAPGSSWLRASCTVSPPRTSVTRMPTATKRRAQSTGGGLR